MSGVSLPEVKWDAQGLAPAVCQDAGTGQVLMLAWMSAESLRLTLENGTVHFWSRSRQSIWHKGETSGNFLRLVSASLDCDGDALLLSVRPDGPACHTGRMSCFFNPVPTGREAEGTPGLPFDPNLLEAIYRLILERRDQADPEKSYVARLFRGGEDRILKKISEEAGEVVLAVKNAKPEEITAETADLWFHSLVALALRDVPPGRVLAELARRFGRGGRPESK
ncbi:MAG: bifunctional phosphoribosyl-AMP cyclohydrolase/phosphoribosyl-ATP diphosphatase HisIE [Candidatus Tectomicrobia bacterium]|uniref:Histidine biosynthesis bifunctional protein HisIE n=1 Tax=Tectimicrobiota bacterium TaxID=2528274 RepID=A0A932I148_UNCTE|nr:bifunctional phosphoribosyl-AMP cyclohydrolase/phosphoribosyl-ATP diphosphatase HisIE [Candidatus Tectomicrobia bacterium]